MALFLSYAWGMTYSQNKGASWSMPPSPHHAIEASYGEIMSLRGSNSTAVIRSREEVFSEEDLKTVRLCSLWVKKPDGSSARETDIMPGAEYSVLSRMATGRESQSSDLPILPLPQFERAFSVGNSEGFLDGLCLSPDGHGLCLLLCDDFISECVLTSDGGKTWERTPAPPEILGLEIYEPKASLGDKGGILSVTANGRGKLLFSIKDGGRRFEPLPLPLEFGEYDNGVQCVGVEGDTVFVFTDTMEKYPIGNDDNVDSLRLFSKTGAAPWVEETPAPSIDQGNGYLYMMGSARYASIAQGPDGVYSLLPKIPVLEDPSVSIRDYNHAALFRRKTGETSWSVVHEWRYGWEEEDRAHPEYVLVAEDLLVGWGDYGLFLSSDKGDTWTFKEPPEYGDKSTIVPAPTELVDLVSLDGVFIGTLKAIY